MGSHVPQPVFNEFPSVVRNIQAEHTQPLHDRKHRTEGKRFSIQARSLIGICAIVAVLSAITIAALPVGKSQERLDAANASTGQWYSGFNLAQFAPLRWFHDPGHEIRGASTSRQRDLFLARSTLIALDHAIRTGNYSVLHHLADPTFQSQNPPKKLEAIFSSLRKSGVDLTFAAVQPLSLNATRMRVAHEPLRISGRFATNAKDVHFDMRFKIRDGLWRLIGIVVAPGGQQQASMNVHG